MIEQYRLKRNTAEAVQLVGTWGETPRDLLRKAVNIALWCEGSVEEEDGRISVKVPTLQGPVRAERGDFIVFSGDNFSVMTADEFRSRYERIPTQPNGRTFGNILQC